ncbi:hypothetical protein PRK78_005742 [Emydomyces testavorans]|uniref:Uncharacterized protein n=1 Tax=Emydomyces testavorans TaxID=2070801 RepID=A0AAF0DKC8_9EURO|nr:hypothetical protein PRK78_005742 [Emydomyces testavorans]
MSDNKSAADRASEARDSYGSLLDYYFDRPASKESIQIGIRIGDIPTEVQAEQLQQQLQEALEVQEILENLGEAEKAEMRRLAFISQTRRKKKQLNKECQIAGVGWESKMRSMRRQE